MIALAPSTRIFVYGAPTDMGKGFCGLSGIVKEHFDADLFDGHLFVFFNRKQSDSVGGTNRIIDFGGVGDFAASFSDDWVLLGVLGFSRGVLVAG